MSKHSQDVPAPSRVGADFGPEAEPSAGCSGATPRAADSLRELHLFAGAGGGILGGMLLGHTPVCAVELDAYCRKVLQARQADGWLPQFPIYEDVRKFDGTAWRGRVDVVAGGFPCQPWSQAGKQKAALEEPWRDLRGLGYRVPPALCVAASDVGAPHIRKRWWLLADSEEQLQPTRLQSGQPPSVRGRRPSHGSGASRANTDADSGGRQKREERDLEPSSRQSAPQRHDTVRPSACNWWKTEPAVGRVVNGLAHRVDRLRALGNGQVPMAAATAWHYLMQQLGT